MNDFIGGCILVVVVVLAMLGSVLLLAVGLGDCRIVDEVEMVESGYAQYNFNPTNGTTKFVWK